MTIARRDLLKEMAAISALPGLTAFFGPAIARAAILDPSNLQGQPAGVDQETHDFWANFVSSTTQPLGRIPSAAHAGLNERGEKQPPDREAFFFHYGGQGFQAAMDIVPSQLLAEGDIGVRYNVAAFKPAAEDRATFERLQNAQLRLDIMQNQPILSILEIMAWTAVATLNPSKSNKLPPLQNLSFNPETSTTKMQNIVLPGGEGRWAMNLYAQRKESLFYQIVQNVVKDFGKFVPVLSLPGITAVALDSFNHLYAALHNRPEYLFRMNPVPVFATASALTSSGASRGLPLRTGSYVLVPVAHASQLTSEVLRGLELKQGFIVPKGTPATRLYETAEATLPNVTYATVDIGVRPVQLPGK